MLTEPARYRNVLVIGTDAFSKILNWKDRRTCVFFGDGAGAVLLTQTDERRPAVPLPPGQRRPRARVHRRCRAAARACPPAADVIEKRLNKFVDERPQGLGVRGEHRARRRSARCSREHGLAPADLDLLILHQSNLRMLEAIMESLELPMEKTVTTVETYGNTAAASIPLTLQKARETGRCAPGARVMLCGFGGGLSWGAALFDW